jgi:transposase
VQENRQKEGMRGRWEVSDAQWELIEPRLRPKRRADGRGRPWQDTRAVLNGILWVLGTGAQWRELPNKYPPYQTCHRRFQQWVRGGKLEGILRVLAEELHARGKLDLEEAFIDASFTEAKKGASRSGQPSAAKGRKSSLSPMITVFLSPLVSKALRRMRANSSKASSGTVSSILSPHD